ncbi:MAG: hypothetical protein ACT4OZ_13660 [Gemmatimonadota bacterium]
MMNRATAQMQQAMAQSRGEMAKTEEARKEGEEVQLEYKVAVETVVEETREISGGAVPADRFTVPSGYREKNLETLR